MNVNAPTVAAPIAYLLHLADNALILGQRNAEWCGHGPVLEEDIAMANISLDLIGQARLLYQYAAQLINAPTLGTDVSSLPPGGALAPWGGPAALKDDGVTEDSLAYFRDVGEFRNYTLLELPHHGPLAGPARADLDYATTIARNFLYSALMVLLWERLQQAPDPQLAAIAAKSLKEVRYHLRHAHDWLLRLGDGTDESQARMQAALDHLLPYTDEFWTPSPAEAAACDSGAGMDVCELREAWNALVDPALAEATLKRPAPHTGYVSQGKQGIHSEHLGFLLAEMQSLARAHPGATW